MNVFIHLNNKQIMSDKIKAFVIFWIYATLDVENHCGVN